MHEAVQDILTRLAERGYIGDRSIATAIHLAIRLEKPLLIEGHAGVGKTEIARVMADVLETDLIRLQCYEGLDAASALYEWNYPRQLLRIRMQEGDRRDAAEREAEIFSPEFLLKRPLLDAITREDRAPVLLIDEVDRADEEFEAFLLEVLADFQVTIPELGTIRAQHRPFVVLTSNRVRELSEALRRRCLYLWIGYPDFAKETRIVEARLPGINRRLAEQIVRFIQRLRTLGLNKPPGVAETLDWARALVALHRDELDEETVEATLGCVLKHVEDVERLGRGELQKILASVRGEP
ncbi:MoxR family ATPase [Thermaerobacter sp. FW80]|uniref:AAA family ATPase n=1 Tax=Thermaerobacter sp. FW80 TaxID=2546351 RepID=UPI001074FB61|nr:MoxR family ATPase [Thermaerobacter sp. FW80]QBS38222.1 MoxR family ATPase [Thermaerobacter sp. FW80]